MFCWEMLFSFDIFLVGGGAVTSCACVLRHGLQCCKVANGGCFLTSCLRITGIFCYLRAHVIPFCVYFNTHMPVKFQLVIPTFSLY